MKLNTPLKHTARAALMLSLMATAMPVQTAQAGKIPEAGNVDARIKTLQYRQDEVYQLIGNYGYSTVIQFGAQENIETISIGNSESWQINKPERGNLLLIKPMEEEATTNMTVITNKRIYSFEMRALTPSHGSPNISYRIQFDYPAATDEQLANLPAPATDTSLNFQAKQQPVSAAVAPENLNFDYAYSGANALRPVRAFDDGKFTYFQFADIKRTPAIFTVDKNGNESLVNYSHQGHYVVVESLAKQFTFRDGDLHTCIFNRNYPVIDTGPLAPVHVSTAAQQKPAVPNIEAPEEPREIEEEEELVISSPLPETFNP